MSQHGSQRGLAHALIEIRQDTIADHAQQRAWATRLARIVSTLLDEPDLAARLHVISTDPRVIEEYDSVCDLSLHNSQHAD